MNTNNGGANGDSHDRVYRKPQEKIKNYRNYEKRVSNSIKNSYRKIFQDAEISKFLHRFPELKLRKERFGTEATIATSNGTFSPQNQNNPFRHDTVSPRKANMLNDTHTTDRTLDDVIPELTKEENEQTID